MGGNNMRRLLWAIVILSTGCAADEVARPAHEQRAQAQALDTRTARDKLRARIDTSALALGPMEAVGEADPFVEDRALAGLADATGGKYAGGWEGSVWQASNDVYKASFDRGSGNLLITGPESYARGLEHATDDVLNKQGTALLGSFVADLDTAYVEVKHLGSTMKALEGDEPAEATERVGSKVFAFRKLGGLRVAGNRLIASYRTDGKLRVARGLWPHIDVAHSRLNALVDRAEAVERALDLLLEHNVNPDRQDPIALESFYELRQGETGWVAVLRAAALVTAYGNDEQPGRRERHDFDL
jgi:hypothetical protein